MKNKINILILLLSCLCVSIYATSTTIIRDVTHPFTIQAGYEEVLEMGITPIISQEQQNFAVGMPFNIEDPSLKPRTSGGLGRQIAMWNFISNTPFAMKAEIRPLTHVHSEAENTKNCTCETQLWYTLGLNFNLSYYSNVGNDQNLEGSFIISPTPISSGGTSEEGDDPTSFIPNRDNPDAEVGLQAYMGVYVPSKSENKVITTGTDPISIKAAIGSDATDIYDYGFIGSSHDSVILAFTPQTYEGKITSAAAGSYEGWVVITIISQEGGTTT